MEELRDFGHNVRPSGRRQGRRVRVCLPASIETLTGFHPAQLTSLSAGGAAVDVSIPVRLGEDLVLRCPDLGLDAFSTVVWFSDGRCGVKFDEPLSDAELLAARTLSDRQPHIVKAQRLAAAKAWSEGRSF